MTRASHYLDIYDVELHLVTTEREWKNLRRRLPYIQRSAPNSAAHTHFGVWEPTDRSAPIPNVAFWIREETTGDPAELICSCAHEATHAATHILQWAGHDIRGDDGHDEPTAYLIGWLTRWLWTNTTNDKARES